MTSNPVSEVRSNRIHKNARLSFRSRELLVRQVIEQARTLKATAAAFQVTVKTAAKWVQRYRVQGSAGLYDRSSRPHRSPRRLPDSLIEHVIQLRRYHTPGYEIARRTAVSAASISRILRRARLSRWRDLHPTPPVVRYERPAPGDLLHLDIKGMTRFQQVSWRGDSRRRGRCPHPGWEALHVAVEDHSRLAFTQILADQKADTTIAFLRAAVDFFARHGIRVRALLSDNGSSYRSHQFRRACQQMGLQHIRTRPLLSPNQWQSRTLHPDRSARVGLCHPLARLHRKKSRPASLEPLLPTASW